MHVRNLYRRGVDKKFVEIINKNDLSASTAKSELAKDESLYTSAYELRVVWLWNLNWWEIGYQLQIPIKESRSVVDVREKPLLHELFIHTMYI